MVHNFLRYTRRYIIFTRIPSRYTFPFPFSLQRCTYFFPSSCACNFVQVHTCMCVCTCICNVFSFFFLFFFFLPTFHSHSASHRLASFHLTAITRTQFSDGLNSDSKFYTPRSTLELNNKGNALLGDLACHVTKRVERYLSFLFLSFFFKNNETWKWK